MKYKLFSVGVIGLLFIGFSGCTKFGKNITVKGRVLNPITGEGYGGVEVWLKKSDNLKYYGGYKEVKHTYTDENGYFEMSAARIGTVWMEANEDYKKYYSLGWYRDGEFYSTMPKVEKGKETHLDYYMVPYGKMKLNINNISCMVTDTMYFKKQWILNKEKYNNWSTPRIGCYSYYGNPFKLPCGKYIYTTKVIRSGNTTYLHDTVTVNESGVSTLTINY